MIDWDIKSILNIQNHYNEIFPYALDLIFFTNHFEQIYRRITDDEVILPVLLEDITYYTLNGINAKDKLLLYITNDMDDKLTAGKIKQRQKRHNAMEGSLDKYHAFLVKELIEFVTAYPQWKQIFG